MYSLQINLFPVCNKNNQTVAAVFFSIFDTFIEYFKNLSIDSSSQRLNGLNQSIRMSGKGISFRCCIDSKRWNFSFLKIQWFAIVRPDSFSSILNIIKMLKLCILFELICPLLVLFYPFLLNLFFEEIPFQLIYLSLQFIVNIFLFIQLFNEGLAIFFVPELLCLGVLIIYLTQILNPFVFFLSQMQTPIFIS